MHQTGHYGAALLAYAPIGFVVAVLTGMELALAGAAVAVALATLPDVDLRVPGVAHRGVTHTLHFALLVGSLLGLAAGAVGTTAGLPAVVALAAFGFVVGTVSIASHVAADALTPMGVDPLLTGERYSLGLTRASNPVANYALFGLGLLAAVVAAWLATLFAG